MADIYLLRDQAGWATHGVSHALAESALPKKLMLTLQQLLWQDIAETELANIKDERLLALGNQLNAWRLQPSGTEGYRNHGGDAWRCGN